MGQPSLTAPSRQSAVCVCCCRIRLQDVPGRMYRGYCFLVLGCLLMLQFILWMGGTYTDTRSQAVEGSRTRVDTVMRDTLDSSVLIDDSVAMDTLSKLKIFCWITTKETEVNKKIPAVNETWAKRCDHRMFVMTTNKPNTGLDILNLNIKDGRQHLTEKSIASLKHIYKHHLDKYDWFLKADDDTFVVMENLKFLLSHYDPTEGVYVGHLFKKYTKWGYMSGGAGYVISRQALRLLVEQGYNKNDTCAKSGTDEDVEVASCLHNVGVPVHNTLDRFGRESFHAFSAGDHIMGSLPKAIQKWDRHETKKGKECCSQLTISFHYVDPKQMRTLEFLLYRISVYGRKSEPRLFHNFFQIGVVPSLPPPTTTTRKPGAEKQTSKHAKKVAKQG
ncbi:glycoprotein-N-acetylgalactosamine 3-beta-galactosyltransferase 1-like [Haliotis rufescens]|uniref:glycoprotein-N-acetylgalactosamine 3-beta-galactosyltransferase 1-like n=1 Tax=Haliotis rufescens TaxID=6454 RepID=UPI00201F8853|nr:glycoprotein-N-acetylgalactosamine 3-beta-galactosyltransferase 1-like [Haliotis rufescens]